MVSEHHFHLEVLAPDGLAGIEPHLTLCRLPLAPYFSHFTQKVILRLTDSEEDFEFGMDGSTTETMHASGYLGGTLNDALERLTSLSKALQAANFPHRIRVDDDATGRTLTIVYPDEQPLHGSLRRGGTTPPAQR